MGESSTDLCLCWPRAAEVEACEDIQSLLQQRSQGYLTLNLTARFDPYDSRTSVIMSGQTEKYLNVRNRAGGSLRAGCVRLCLGDLVPRVVNPFGPSYGWIVRIKVRGRHIDHCERPSRRGHQRTTRKTERPSTN